MTRIRDVIFALLVVVSPLVLPEDRFFDSAGVRIRYVERGEGQPVVLLHGFSRDIEVDWIEPGILERLARDYRVIAMDARGHGRSSKPEGDAYGHRMVEDVARLLDHLRIDSVHLIGYSMGGRIALKFAAMHPGRVRSVVLIGTGGAGICLTDLPDPNEAQVTAINVQTFSFDDPNVPGFVARGYRELALSQEQIDAIRAPALAVFGSGDDVRVEVDRLKELMPRLTVRMVEGADHVSILERPELLAVIEAFLKNS